MFNPYQPPLAEQDLLARPPLSPAEARSHLRLPAMGLIASGIAGLVLVLFAATGGLLLPPDTDRAMISPAVDLVMMLAAGVFVGLLQLLMLLSGRAMLQLRGYGFARRTATMAAATLGGACLIGLPFAVWALVLLYDRRIQGAFASQ